MLPGLYPNLPEAEYHASAGISNSGLRVLGEYSPAHYIAYRNEPREETPAKTEGRRAHSAILEPHLFESRYAVSPKFDMRKNADKEAFAHWQAENVGKEAIEQSTFDRLRGMRDAVHRNMDARQLLSHGHIERSVYAADPTTGVLVKARPDNDPSHALADLKSSADVRPEQFSADAFRYGYFQQAAFYLDVLSWAGQSRDGFFFIAFEKHPPFGVRVYEASATMIRRGRDAYRPALDLYAECVANNRWPCYEDGITQLDLPPWVEKRLDAAQNDDVESISYVEQ